ncbi:MAG: N-acetyltransferase [Lentilitoribacter sp.]
MTTIIITDEQETDAQAIYDLTEIAFKPMAYSDGTEAPLVGKLRADGDLIISLVAMIDTRLVGHVAFSKVTINSSHNGWYGLGPISVHPDLQKQGIGGLLIKEGFARLKALGANGCALIGDPKYYKRFGFQNDGKLSYANVPKEAVMWISFHNEPPEGVLKFLPAFGE